jgi:hypothetical protein
MNSVQSIELFTDLKMYGESDPEKKGLIVSLVTALLQMAGKVFPNVSRIKMELPEDGPLHEVYRAVYDLTQALPKLQNKAEISIDVGKSKVSFFFLYLGAYTFHFSCYDYVC